MKIKVTADSTCDLSKELIEKHDISIIPLYIVMGDQSYRDGVEVSVKDIFEYVDSGKGSCSTAAINVVDYLSFFSRWREEYDAVIHINLSSEISACHQNARIAAQELSHVFPVDSRSLSTGSGYLALDAAEMARRGASPEEIVEFLHRRRAAMNTSFVLDTLKYLRKGGRCSALQALGANMLSLKPCIEMIDGRLDVGKKYRGSLSKCVAKYVEDRLADGDNLDGKRIFITHTFMDQEIVDKVRQLVEETGLFEEVLETTAGCTISNHCGPRTLGILYSNKIQ